jgi:hypothetical protein
MDATALAVLISLDILATVGGFAFMTIVAMRGFREMHCMWRATAGLIVQESEKVQDLLREA